MCDEFFKSKDTEVAKSRFTEEEIEKILAEIEELDPAVEKAKKEKASADAPARRLSICVDDAYMGDLGWEKPLISFETFSTAVLNHIKKSGMSNKEFYDKAQMDRKLFSAMKNNREYQPKKTYGKS